MTDEDKRKLLTALRDRIPEIECIPGCTDCCGHTAWSRFEWGLLPEKDRERFDFFSFKCSFCNDDGCSIHADRSIICRMFGVMEGLPCSRGVRPPQILDKETSDAIGKTYVKHFFKGDHQ